MTFEEIEAIVRELDGQAIAAAEIRVGAARLKLRFVADATKEQASTAPPMSLATSPSPGRFQPVHPLENAPRFSEGDQIGKGDIIAYVKANGVLLPVIAAGDLVLGRALVEDGAAVGWGTALYETR